MSDIPFSISQGTFIEEKGAEEAAGDSPMLSECQYIWRKENLGLGNRA